MDVTLGVGSMTIKDAVSVFIAGTDLRSVSIVTEEIGTSKQFNYSVSVTTVQNQSYLIPLTPGVGSQKTWINDLNGAIIARNAILAIAGVTGSAIVPDGNYGDITVSGGGSTWTINPGVVTAAMMNSGAAAAGEIPTADGGGGVVYLPPSGGSGDVVGPASSVDENIAIFDGVTGKLIKDSGFRIDQILEEDPGIGIGLIESSGVVPFVLKNIQQDSGIELINSTGRIDIKLDFSAADKFWYGGLLGEPTEGDITAAGRALLDDATASDQRTTLGLGTAAVADTGTGPTDVPTITDADARYELKGTSIDTMTIMPPSSVDWANMPAALTFFSNQSRWVVPLSLTDREEIKFHVLMGTVAGAAGSKIRLLYKTQASGFSTTITDYVTMGTSEVQVTIGTSTLAVISTAWIPLVAGAKDDVLVAMAGIDGDGVADPRFFNAYIEVR